MEVLNMEAKEAKTKPEPKKKELAKRDYKRYAKDVKDQAIELHRAGKKPKEIVVQLNGPKIKAIKRWIRRYEKLR